jgi:hypothetical protein
MISPLFVETRRGVALRRRGHDINLVRVGSQLDRGCFLPGRGRFFTTPTLFHTCQG